MIMKDGIGDIASATGSFLDFLGGSWSQVPIDNTINYGIYGPDYYNANIPMPPAPQPPTSMVSSGTGVSDANAVNQVVTNQGQAWQSALQNYFNTIASNPTNQPTTTTDWIMIAALAGIGIYVAVKIL